MLTAILVDDEQDSLQSLEADLKDYCPQVKVVASCDTPLKALKAITREEVDVVFLDIHMPGLNGFELLEIIGEIDFFVIFITVSRAYEDAVNAFGIRNANYLPKPIDEDRLVEAVQRVEEQKNLQLQVETAGDQPTPEPLNHGSVAWTIFQDRTDYICVRNEDIIYLRSDGDHSKLYVANPDYYQLKHPYIHINDGLGRTAERLAQLEVFYRIHKKYLINLNHIVRVETLSTKRLVHLSDGSQVQVAINSLPGFLATLRSIR